MKQVLLSVDVGTTGCKVIAFSRNGQAVFSTYAEYSTVVGSGGRSELDPQIVWQKVSCCIKDAAADSAIDITAVCVSSLGEAAVLLDKKDRVLGNAILYNDFRGSEEMAELLNEELRAYIPQTTGQPVSYLHTLWKLIWLSRHDQEQFEKIEHILFFADYIVFRLTGQYVTDYSLAARSLAFNIGTLSWDDRLVALTGLERTKFPKPLPSGTVVGHLTPEAAAEFSISPKAVVVTGGHDQPCGVLGSVAARTGHIVSASGTIEAITATVDDISIAERLIRCGFSVEPAVVPGKYMAMAISLTGGSLLKWFRSAFTEASTDIGSYRNIYAFLDSRLERSPAKSMVVPYLCGTGTPDYDTRYCGQIYGLRPDITREDIYKACMEGLCFEMQKAMQIMEAAGLRMGCACVIGGGAYSTVWPQMKADIWNIPVQTAAQSEAVALGLAALAAAAVGWFSSPEEAAGRFIDQRDEFLPDPGLHRHYQEKYRKFLRLSEVCRETENEAKDVLK